jgi:hypothetical protein
MAGDEDLLARSSTLHPVAESIPKGIGADYELGVKS